MTLTNLYIGCIYRLRSSNLDRIYTSWRRVSRALPKMNLALLLRGVITLKNSISVTMDWLQESNLDRQYTSLVRRTFLLKCQWCDYYVNTWLSKIFVYSVRNGQPSANLGNTPFINFFPTLALIKMVLKNIMHLFPDIYTATFSVTMKFPY